LDINGLRSIHAVGQWYRSRSRLDMNYSGLDPELEEDSEYHPPSPQ
jgi:hypothetical protein